MGELTSWYKDRKQNAEIDWLDAQFRSLENNTSANKKAEKEAWKKFKKFEYLSR